MAVNANQLSLTSESLGIPSFNMHGFKNGLAMLSELCLDNRFNVIAVQEHWLHRSMLNSFNVVNNEFEHFAISGMGNASSSGIL